MAASYLNVRGNTTGLSALSKDLERASRSTRRSLRRGLKAGGSLVMAEAKERASFSSTIPGTIVMRSKGRRVVIEAGGADVPIAGLEELGNKGRRSSAGVFRHPVFEVSTQNGGGGRTLVSHSTRHPELVTPAGLSRLGGVAPWVTQKMHPYLAPALAARREDVVEEVSKAVGHELNVVSLYSSSDV